MAVSLCTVSFSIKIGNTAVEGAVCKARLLGTNQGTAEGVLSNQESSATTDSAGDASLSLVQHGEITKGSGVYKIWVEINGNSVASVRTKIPNQGTFSFEDLIK